MLDYDVPSIAVGQGRIMQKMLEGQGLKFQILGHAFHFENSPAIFGLVFGDGFLDCGLRNRKQSIQNMVWRA